MGGLIQNPLLRQAALANNYDYQRYAAEQERLYFADRQQLAGTCASPIQQAKEEPNPVLLLLS